MDLWGQPGYRHSGNKQAGNNSAGDRRLGDNLAGDMQAGNRQAGDMQAGNRQAGDMQAGNMQAGMGQAGKNRVSNVRGRNKQADNGGWEQKELQSNAMGYMPGLDGLRALAVFLVIAYHLNLPWAPGGLLGVNLFFVLSGYLITDILLNKGSNMRPFDLQNFWLRRARRLLPALVAMLTGVMFWVMLCRPEYLVMLKKEALAAVFYASNWYLILHNVSYFESFGPPSPLGHLWSLAIEGQFYLLWPLLLGFGLYYPARRKWVVKGTVVLSLFSLFLMLFFYLPGHDPSRVYYGTDTRFFALLIGALLAMGLSRRRVSASLSVRKRLMLDSIGAIGLFIVFLMTIKTNQYQPFLYRGGFLLYSLVAAGVIAVLAHPQSRLGKLFSWRPLRWLGECSYGIYLWHYPVIILTTPSVNTKGLDIGLISGQIGLTIILAALSRYLIEEPIRYGHWRPLARLAPDRQYEQRPLLQNVRRLGSLAIISLVLLIAANQSLQILAKDLPERDMVDKRAGDMVGKRAGDIVDKRAFVTEKQLSGTEEPGQVIEKEQIVAAAAVEKGDITTSQETNAEMVADRKGDGITAIGDSLMIDIEPILRECLPGIIIDAQIGRQMYQAPEIIAELQREGKLGKKVIIELGTNGPFTDTQLKSTLDTLEDAELIVLINTRVARPWEKVVNEVLTKISGDYPNTILVDWYSASSGHDGYFYPDGVHLNQRGAEVYSEIIIERLFSGGKSEQQSCYNNKKLKDEHIAKQ